MEKRSKEQRESPEEASIIGLRLLLVDDDPPTNEAMKELLEHQGAIVQCAESVRDALELCDRESFDLMISDISLQGENGLSLVRELRRREQGAPRATPALAMSGYTTPEHVAEMLEAGFDDHIGKPIEDFAAFRARICDLARKGSD